MARLGPGKCRSAFTIVECSRILNHIGNAQNSTHIQLGQHVKSAQGIVRDAVDRQDI